MARLNSETNYDGLNTRQKAFVDLIASGESVTGSARQAGYSDPKTAGFRLLRDKKVRAAVEEKKTVLEALAMLNEEPESIDIGTPDTVVGYVLAELLAIPRSVRLKAINANEANAISKAMDTVLRNWDKLLSAQEDRPLSALVPNLDNLTDEQLDALIEEQDGEDPTE